MKKHRRRIGKTQTEFILTGKLFCGNCGTTMVGDSGTSHTGVTHYYYSCLKKKNQRACKKKSVRKDIIETAVINYLLDVLLDKEMIERMADIVLEEQRSRKDSSVLKPMKAELAAVRKKIENLNNAIADGIYSRSTREMLVKLEASERELFEAVATVEFTEAQMLTRDKIIFWMQRFTEGDRVDPDFRSRLINIFLNSVYVFDNDDGGQRMKIVINSVAEEPLVLLPEMEDVCTGSNNDPESVLKRRV
ncbi:MAG: zinc ribbon domain-containing protein [Clostridia bacterium]|nr:zinc ribbon domain-containing protein [Clostridia bacterium]